MKTTFLAALLITLLFSLSHPAHAQGTGQGSNGSYNGYGGRGGGLQGGNQNGIGSGFNGSNNGSNNGAQQVSNLKLPEGVFKIYALEGDNSLVIVATPEGYRRVMAFLRSLGVVHSSYRITDFDGNSFQVIPTDNKGHSNS